MHWEYVCSLRPVAVRQLPQADADYPRDAKTPGRKEQEQGIAAPIGNSRGEQGDEDYTRQNAQKLAVVKNN